jgi:hypothetical protein
MDLELVKRSICLLLYYQVVMLVDILRFSNVYQCTSNGFNIVMHITNEAFRYQQTVNSIDTNSNYQTSINLMNDLIEFSSLSFEQSISPSRICRFICSFRYGTNLATIIMDNKDVIEVIDVRKFIGFATFHRILRRVYEYPVDLSIQRTLSAQRMLYVDNKISQKRNFSSSKKKNKDGNRKDFRKYIKLDGTETLDAMCVTYDITPEDLFQEYPNLLVIYK